VPAIAVAAGETEDGTQSLCLTIDMCALFKALRKMGLSMSVPMQLVALIGRLATPAQSNRAKQKNNEDGFEKKRKVGVRACACVGRAKVRGRGPGQKMKIIGRKCGCSVVRSHHTHPILPPKGLGLSPLLLLSAHFAAVSA